MAPKKRAGAVAPKTQSTENLTSRPCKRTKLLFQRIKDRNQRYKLVNRKVIKESEHTSTLENGSVLRKSGVAEKANRALTLSPKGKYTKPPTLEEVRQKLNKDYLARSKTTHSTAKSQLRSKSQNWGKDDDSDSTSEYEPLG